MKESPKRIKTGPADMEWLAKVLMLYDKNISEPDFQQLFLSLPSICLLLYPAKVDVLKEGDYSKDLFVIYTGKLGVLKKKGLNPPEEEARLGPADFFGELGFLLGVKRSATVRTEEESKIFRFSADEFEKMLSKNKPLSLKVRKLALSRLKNIFMKGL